MGRDGKPEKKWTQSELEFIRANLDKGNNWIANELGRTISQVKSAKFRFGIGRKKKEITKEREELHKELHERAIVFYQEGLGDRLIAMRLSVTPIAITRWRKRNNLAPNGYSRSSRYLISCAVKRGHKKKALLERRARDPEAHRTSRAKPGSYNYNVHSEDQTEFMFACKGRMNHLKKVSLTYSEMLEVALALGYRRVERATFDFDTGKVNRDTSR